MNISIRNRLPVVLAFSASLLFSVMYLSGCVEPSEPQQSIDPPLTAEPTPPPEAMHPEPPPEPVTSAQPDTVYIEPLAPPPLSESTEAPTPLPPVADVPTVPLPTTPPVSTPPPKPDSRASSTGLIIPVAGIGPEDLIDTYTQARSGGRVHNAIDIIAPQGTPVLAAVKGVIKRFFTSDKGGLTIYQMGPDKRTVYYYAHLDRYADGLKKGDTVQSGQVIGYVGDTGNAVPGNYHLHFAIWLVEDPASYWDGESLNPYPLLQDARKVDGLSVGQ